jgi:uncharacterized membrane protein
MLNLRPLGRWLFGLSFIVAGAAHFVLTPFYVAIMPPYLPWPRELVYLSGLAEIGLGALLLVPRFTRLAGWGLIALLIAVFPANLHMALNPQLYPFAPPLLLYLRLPLQLVLIAWAYAYTRSTAPAAPPAPLAPNAKAR